MLPEGWARVSLGECTEAIQYGLTCTSNLEGTGFRYIRITDIQDRKIDWQNVPYANETIEKATAYEVSPNDILFARTGATVGKSYLITALPYRAAFASYLIRVRCVNDLLTPRFAAWFFQSPEYWDQIYEGAGGTGQPNFNGSKLGSLSFSLPPLAEQRRIVAKLDALTARLARARAELERIAPLAKRLRASALAQAYEGITEFQRLKDLSNFVTSGSRGWAKYYSDDGAAFIRVGDVRRGNIQLDTLDLQRVMPPEGGEGMRTALQSNDIVITITADLGRVGVVPDDLGPAYVNQHVSLVRPIDKASAKWIAWYLCSEKGQEQLLAKDRGITKAGLGLDDIRNVLIPIVEPCRRDEVVKEIECAFARADRLEAEAARSRKLLDRLESAILAKAFRGELVPQDPNDEPASALLERIRAQRAGDVKPSRGRRKTG